MGNGSLRGRRSAIFSALGSLGLRALGIGSGGGGVRLLLLLDFLLAGELGLAGGRHGLRVAYAEGRVLLGSCLDKLLRRGRVVAKVRLNVGRELAGEDLFIEFASAGFNLRTVALV
jgi:hypothetical protein